MTLRQVSRFRVEFTVHGVPALYSDRDPDQLPETILEHVIQNYLQPRGRDELDLKRWDGRHGEVWVVSPIPADDDLDDVEHPFLLTEVIVEGE